MDYDYECFTAVCHIALQQQQQQHMCSRHSARLCGWVQDIYCNK